MGTKGRKRWYFFAAVATSNLVAVSTGITLGWTSPVFPKISNSKKLDENPFGREISSEEASWIGSILGIGSMFGPFLSGFLIDRVGRKYTLIISSGLFYFVHLLILAFAKSIYLYYFARFVGGAAVGSFFMVFPIYVSEITEPSIRGAVISTLCISISLGTLYVFSLGPYMSILCYSLACAVVPGIFLLVFPFFYKTPYYLVAINKIEEAEKSLMKYRGATSTDEISAELQTIITNVQGSEMSKLGNIKLLWQKKENRKAMRICLCVGFVNQSCGVHVIYFYITDIFEASGSGLDANISSIIFACLLVSSSFLAPILADRWGRKVSLQLSAIGIIIAEVPLSIYFILKDRGNDVSSIGWLPLIAVFIFLSSFNLGLGPTLWTIMAEMFAADVKSFATNIVASFVWLMSFLVTKYYVNISDLIGIGATFLIFAGTCLAIVFFVHFCVIETKGKTFDEIQEILRQ